MATSNPSSTIASAAENAAERVSDVQVAATERVAEVIDRGKAVAQEARDSWAELDRAVRERPYAALAIAAAAGFLYAAVRR